ncbi:ankyrin repeat domain-containing protein 16-like isoform X2 [Biomphalaria glabrata]|uniref:Ankyrin repeat domain-containing protein 16-like isoform X2 n=1 Tax=Biomphalaria glabrata TaxID=6526 RepID=A0A9W3A7Z2_BIOGL|nr:ankyrin repeat domain-containing protein 16-like isoform X2 [Biomphalaria glabrata]
MEFKAVQDAVIANNLSFFENSSTELLACMQHSKSFDTPLHIACRLGKADILKYLIDSNKTNLEACNREGKRPLHEAAHNSHDDCVCLLLGHKVQVDPFKSGDWTPLMLACTKSSLSTVQILLQTGADPCLKNKDGWNSFHIACREGHLTIVQCLMKFQPDIWNTKSKNHRSPLHTAALYGRTETVLYLVTECSYCTDEKDCCGVTPLMDALRAGHVDTAHVLINLHKASIIEEDKMGRQSLHLTAQSSMLTALEYLLGKGLSVNSRSARLLETPLHLAAMEGHSQTGERLIELGAEINARDYRERSALHYASCGQHCDFVALLLSHGAECFPDVNGHLPQILWPTT